LGFKDFENKVKDVRKLAEEHREAVEQSIIPLAEDNDANNDCR
jgi:hypothetical protein